MKAFVLAAVLLFVSEQNLANANVINLSPVSVRSVGLTTGYDYTTDNLIAGVITPVNYYNKKYRAYEKFNLPDYGDGLTIGSAVLTFTTRGEFPYLYTPRLGVFGVADLPWGMNWYSQPMVTSGLLGTMSSNGGIFQIDITTYLQSIYTGPTSATFMVKSLFEDQDFQDVVSIFAPTLSVKFDQAVVDNPTPASVPEPGIAPLFALGFALLFAQSLLRKKNV